MNPVEYIKRCHNYEAMIIAGKAILRLAERYAELAAELAKKEKDEKRKKELEEIAEVCRWVPANPPRTFREALQAYWLIEVVFRFLEAPSNGSGCRLDQIWYPYYKKDIEEGSICRAEALELIQKELKAAGLGSLPGGGAEIFADRVRRLVAPGKEHPEYWFMTHDTAHRLGIPTHCTMLYGHVETYEERVDHLLRLRDQQARTGGFLAFVPLAFHPENTVFERRGFAFTPGAEDLKVIAVSRLLLDNVPNIKAYWIMMGLPMAQIALHFGANDVQGTVVREEIFQAAGATAGTEQKVEELVRTIREAGRIPVQRDTLYNAVRRWED